MKHLYLNFLIFSVIACSNLFAQSNIRFIENKGQWENPFLYKANLGGGSLFIEKNAFTYNFYNANEYQFHHLNVGMNKTSRNSEKQLRFHAFKVNFLNINSSVKISSTIPYPEYYNYFLGSDKNRWKSKVKAYQKINYNELYPNINLEIYSVGNALKYDVIVNSGGKVNNVQLSYKGVDKIELDENGNLLIITSVNQLTEQKPYAYQLIEGKKVEIPSKFVLKDNIVSFKLLKSYNKKIPLIIDPVLIFSSYSGSFADNFGMSATYGTDGSLFAGGTVFNVGYPVTLGAFDPSFNGFPATGITDVAISRYDSTGTSLIYSTYLGGVQAETVHSMITNDNNELYLYGVTSSIDFPVLSNAYDTTFNGGKQLRFVNNGTFFNAGTDIYVAKLNASGTSLLGGTYIGGTNNDGVNHSNDSTFVFGIWSPKYDSLQNNYSDQYRGEIFLDKNNDCYIASSTRSSDFPIVNGFDNTLGGKQDGIVFKLDNNLTTLKWSSYLGEIGRAHV